MRLETGNKWFLPFVLLLVAVMGICVFPAPVQADPILDFAVGFPTPGSISYAGGPTPLVGTNIQVDNVIGGDTPSNNGVLLVLSNATLKFTTGNFSGSTANTWDFSGGGAISLVGGVPALLIPDGTTLFSGSFLPAMVATLGTTFKIAGAAFSDLKNPDLVAFYGLPSGISYAGNFNISFNTAASSPPAAFSSTSLLSGDITNTPIPEPASLTLVGSAMIGLASFARRRLFKI